MFRKLPTEAQAQVGHGCEDSQFIVFLAIRRRRRSNLKFFDFVTSIGALIGLPLRRTLVLQQFYSAFKYFSQITRMYTD